MQDQELITLWKSYDSKMDAVLAVNQQIVSELTQQRLQKTIGKLRRPKTIALLIGIPYTLLIFAITGIAWAAGGIFPFIGFGIIGLIMTFTLCLYGYHLHLISQINGADDIQSVQVKLSKLKLASFQTLRIALLQLPFWVICWISLDEVLASPWVYGGINLLLVAGACYLTYWLFRQISPVKPDSKVRRFFLSGHEWEPLAKASHILEQLEAE